MFFFSVPLWVTRTTLPEVRDRRATLAHLRGHLVHSGYKRADGLYCIDLEPRSQRILCVTLANFQSVSSRSRR